MHADVQDRVHAEIASLGRTDHDDITYDDTMKLTYTDMVLKETLRLFPPAAFQSRAVTKDTELSNCTLPSGTDCLIPVFKIHRDPGVWGANSNDFDPDRFSPERSNEIDPFFLLAFSYGPRNCIGHKFAMYSMKILLCHLVSRFKFNTAMKMNELEFSFVIALKLLNKYEIAVERR